MATYDFTGANGDPLPSGLTVRSGTFEIQSNAATPTGSAPALPTWVFTGEGSADDSIEFDVDINSTSGVAGAAVRLNPSDNSHLLVRARYDGGGANEGILVYTYDGGYTEISSTLCTVPVNATLKVEFTGSSYTVYIGGVQQHTFTSTYNQTQINHGVRLNNSAQSVDNLTIVGGSASGDTITISDAEFSNIVYQRNASDVATVSFDVAYTGSPTSLRYRLLNESTLAVISDWAVFDASPAGGASTLSFSADASTIGYVVEVDFSNDATVNDTQTAAWRVGDNILIAGQSLAEDFDTDGAVTALDGYYKFNGSQGIQPTTGVGAYTIAKAIVDAENVAVMVVNTGDGGTPLTQEAGDSDWWNRSSGGTLWPNTVTQVNSMTAGQNKLAFVWWHQGTRDSLAGVSQAVYETQLGEFFTMMRAAFTGYDGNPLKVISALLGRDTRGTATDASHQAIRDAQISYASSDANLYPINAYQSANEDGVHATDAAYILLAQQISLKWYAVKGDVTAPPMVISSVTQGGTANEIDLTFSRALNSTDSTYDTEGVRVTDGSGDLTIQSFSRKTGAVATITTQETPSGTVLVWLSYGVGSSLNQLVYPKSEVTSLPNAAGDFFYVAEAFSAQELTFNTPPTANAGIDQSDIAAGATVQLDGSASTDGDGTIVSYAWAQTAGTAVILTGAATATPSFTAPTTASAQTLTFELTVTDDNAATDTDTVDIGVLASSARPFFINKSRNFDFFDKDGIWTDNLREKETDSYTFTIDPNWVSPEAITDYSVTPSAGITVVAQSRQDNVIQLYLRGDIVGRNSVRVDFETATRSDHALVYLDVVS